MRSPRRHLTWPASVLLAVPAASQGFVTLTPGVAVEVDLVAGPSAFRVDVDDESSGLRFSTAGSDDDVELYAAFDRIPDVRAGDFDVAAANLWLEETLLIEASDAVPLQPGAWYVAVVPVGDAATRTTLTAELLRPSEHTAVVGEVLAFELQRAHGLRARVELELPVERGPRASGPTRWLVEVDCPFADVDVNVVASGLLSGFEEPYASSQDLHGYERLEAVVPRFRRRIALDVFAYQESEHAERLPVRVLVQRNQPPEHVPTRDICPLPRLPDAATRLAAAPFDAAAKATVVVVGPYGAGSGVVVSPDGYVLTCAHVLVGAEGSRPPAAAGEPARPPIAIGFALDPAAPPAPAFGAEVVGVRQDLDLALVKITGDLLGRSLESRLGARCAFPWLAAAERRPLMAERMYGFGYPVTGGTATMVTLTMTSGVCAGYAREVEGVLLKTDAEIHSGDSGGPFVDAAGRLVGIAVSSLADADKGGGIGFVVPHALVPEEWRARLR